MKPLKAGVGSPLPSVGGWDVLISLSEWSIFVKISCVFMNSLFGHGFDAKMCIADKDHFISDRSKEVTV